MPYVNSLQRKAEAQLFDTGEPVDHIEPDDDLTEEEQDLWREIFHTRAAGYFRSFERPLMRQHVKIVLQVQRFELRLQTPDDYVTVDRFGTEKVNPLATAANQLHGQFMASCRALRIGPANRMTSNASIEKADLVKKKETPAPTGIARVSLLPTG